MPVLLDDLQQQIAKGQVIAIVGAGVSIGATGADTASWIGLLKNGIKRCEEVGDPRPNPGWGDRQRAALDDGQLDELLSVASQIESRLGAPTGGEYRRWLRESVGTLRTKDRTTVEALRDLGVPLATTNYDGLIEEATKLPAVTWRDGARIQRVIRDGEPGILHLHGYWEQPESVVLGIRSYDQVLGDAHAQTVQSALALMKSFLFVGYGAGLADPNFGALLQWMSKVFAGSEYRHFRLCRDDEIDAVQKQHPPEERIFAVGYGASHADLVPFLRRRKPKTTPPPTPPEKGAPAPLPPRPARIFGRDQLVEDLVTTLLLDIPPPVAVLGGPGFGKSTLCLEALHEPRVAARFGARRWLVRCDAANTAEDMLKEITLALGVGVGPSLGPRVLTLLREAPGVLVIDNAETPWEAAPLATEELLDKLSGVSGLALIATIRGQQRPHGPAWRDPSPSATPLEPADSRKVFLAIAGEQHASDRHLSNLLAALDGIPLLIELLAYAAEAEPDLEGLWRRWQEERIALLRRADGSTRLVNAALSFELSITGRRMTDEGRQLLSAMSFLPDGIAHQDLRAVMPAYPDRAAATLRQVGLAFDQAGRLRVLAPIREHVAVTRPPSPEALAPALAHYTALARDLGQKVGGTDGEEAFRRLAANARNIEEVLAAGLTQADPEGVVRGILNYAAFLGFSGLGSPRLLEQARQIAGAGGNARLEAECVYRLGYIAEERFDHDAARTHFEDAQRLYQKARYMLGVAYCIEGLGNIALRRSELDPAQNHYENAQRLFEREGYLNGIANCIKGLGDIAFRRPDYDTASIRYAKARSLYEKIHEVMGMANCIARLGDIALARSDHKTARARYEEAQPLYRQVGDVLGVANCLNGLGNVALARSEHDRSELDIACGYYEEALPLYRQVGNLMGEAGCILGLGQITLALSDHGTARVKLEKALALYERVPDPYSIGNAHWALAKVAGNRSDRKYHIAAARDAYQSIQRDDLIQRLNMELGA